MGHNHKNFKKGLERTLKSSTKEVEELFNHRYACFELVAVWKSPQACMFFALKTVSNKTYFAELFSSDNSPLVDHCLILNERFGQEASDATCYDCLQKICYV